MNKKKSFLFSVQGLPEDTFAVARFSGDESLSQLFRFDLELVTENHQLDEDEVVGKAACLTFVEAHGKARHRWGTVAELTRLRENGRYSFYELALVPRLWDLSLHHLSEVHLGERSTPEIAKDILAHAGLVPGIDFEFRLSSDYRKRTFVCQYQESDFAFISRWLEWEGIAYWFEHEDGRDKAVFSDNQRFHKAAEDSHPYRPAAQLDPGHHAVTALACRKRTVPAKVVIQDYNYRKSPLEVKAEAVVDPKGRGEKMLYGENVRTDAEAKKIAGIRAEELKCQARTYHGEGLGSKWQPGRFMRLKDHPRQDFNRDYLVTEVHHEGSQTAILLAGVDREGAGDDQEVFHRCEFTAIHHDTQYRPAAATPWPRFHGTMNATVDAEGTGKYAEVNEYGQYRVQLPFDKTDKSSGRASAWLRFATPYSGQDHGMHFPLHKGAEVLLSFIDGDPDQPIIVGAVPNSENRNMVTDENQTQNVIQTAGENRMEMEDQEGSQRVHMSTPTADTFMRIGAPLPPMPGVGADAVTPDNIFQQVMWAFSPPSGVDVNNALSGGNEAWGKAVASAGIEVQSKGNLVMKADGVTSFTLNGTEYKCTVQDSVKCTKGNSYSITIGDSYSVTQGNSTKATKGWSKSITEGNSDAITKGDSNKETYGNSKSITHGNSYSATYGDSTSTYKGVKVSTALSSETSFACSNKNDFFLGNKNSVTLGLNFDAKMLASIAAMLGLEYKFYAGAMLSHNIGAKLEFSQAADLRKTIFDGHVGTITMKDVLTKITDSLCSIDFGDIDIGSSLTSIGSSDLHILM